MGFEYCSLTTFAEIHQTTTKNPLFFAPISVFTHSGKSGRQLKKYVSFRVQEFSIQLYVLKGVRRSEADNIASFNKDQVWKEEVASFQTIVGTSFVDRIMTYW